MSQKKNIFKHTLSMGIATYVAQGIGIVTSIAMRASLTPTNMGIWTILQVILGYCGYASLGTTRAMSRDYPIARGRGDHEEAEHLKNLTVTFSMAMSIIPALFLFCFTAWKWASLDMPFRIGLIFLCFFLFLQRFYDFLINLLRSDKRFDLLSALTVWNALGMLAIVFVLVRPFSIYGLMAGTLIATVACLLYILKRQHYVFVWYWNRGKLLLQLKLGLPLLAISFLGTFYKSIDKLLIAKYMGFSEVGFYSIAMMITSFIYAFPMMLSNVLYPHTLEEYGRECSKDSIAKHLQQPVLVLSVLVPVLCGFAVFLAPVLVDWFMPNFSAGLPAMKIYLLSIFFTLMSQFASNVLTTLNRYWINVPILLISSGLSFILNILFIRMGFGLTGVAWGTAFSFAVYGTAMYLAAGSSLGRLAESFQSAGWLILISSSVFAGIFFIDRMQFGELLLYRALIKTGFFVFFSMPFIVYLEWKTGVFRAFRREK